MWLILDQIKSKQCHFDVQRFSASLMKKVAEVAEAEVAQLLIRNVGRRKNMLHLR
jgi:hypothetical protein